MEIDRPSKFHIKIIAVFWDMKLHRVIERYRLFGGMCCIGVWEPGKKAHLWGKEETELGLFYMFCSFVFSFFGGGG
jgi:hypothetical protein